MCSTLHARQPVEGKLDVGPYQGSILNLNQLDIVSLPVFPSAMELDPEKKKVFQCSGWKRQEHGYLPIVLTANLSESQRGLCLRPYYFPTIVVANSVATTEIR